MLKNVLEIKGIRKLKKSELKKIDGSSLGDNGFWVCTRYQNGVSHTFYGNQSYSTAVAWENSWRSLGWNANCIFRPFHLT